MSLHRPKSPPETHAIVVGGALLVALAFAAIAFALWLERGRILEEGHRVASNLTRLLAEQTLQTVQAVDLTLIDMVNAQKLAPSRAGHDFRYEDTLRQKLPLLPYIRALYVIGSDGFVIQDTRYPDTTRVRLVDRGYFIAHRNDPHLGLQIGRPLISRSDGTWFVSMSRRIDRPDGGFGGVAVAAIEPRYFERFYQTLELGDRDSILLFLRDGTVIARSPYIGEAIGRSFAESSLFGRHLASSPNGTHRSISPVDGVRRIFSYRALEGLPLVVAVGLDEDAVLAGWRSKVAETCVAAALLVLLGAAMTGLAIRTKRQRAQARQQIIQAQRLEALGQMTGGIVHDFNNLMTVIAVNLRSIQKSVADDGIRQLAETAAAATARGTKLLSQLLAFARQQELAVRAADLNELILDLEILLENAAGPKADIVLKLAPGLWPSKVDSTQFGAALLNLVVNAKDAMPSGGRVRISTANDEQSSDGRQAGRPFGDYVRVSVRDSGHGMPPEVRERALEPFFTTKEPGKGTGLGLSQVYGFVRQIGGDLRIESEPGAGTSVHLLFPRASPEAPAQHDAPPSLGKQ